MAFPEIVTREEWLEARKQFLAREKQATRERDALNADRRRLPMVAVEKEYVFEGPEGRATLAGLFGDSRQLIVQHVMFGPDWEAACPGCTAGVDERQPHPYSHRIPSVSAGSAARAGPGAPVTATSGPGP